MLNVSYPCHDLFQFNQGAGDRPIPVFFPQIIEIHSKVTPCMGAKSNKKGAFLTRVCAVGEASHCGPDLHRWRSQAWRPGSVPLAKPAIAARICPDGRAGQKKTEIWPDNAGG